MTEFLQPIVFCIMYTYFHYDFKLSQKTLDSLLGGSLDTGGGERVNNKPSWKSEWMWSRAGFLMSSLEGPIAPLILMKTGGGGVEVVRVNRSLKRQLRAKEKRSSFFKVSKRWDDFPTKILAKSDKFRWTLRPQSADWVGSGKTYLIE